LIVVKLAEVKTGIINSKINGFLPLAGHLQKSLHTMVRIGVFKDESD
jgi:hypothetical protein